MSAGTGVGREAVWDVLRGAGVLGIFALNIHVFAAPSSELLVRQLAWDEDWPLLLSLALANGKFIALLAAIYGAGFAMLWRRDVASGRSTAEARTRLLRRCVVLVALGVAHYLLLFWGDILQWYGLVGLIAAALVSASDRTLLVTSVGGVAAAVFVGTAMAGLQVLVLGLSSEDVRSWIAEDFAAELAVFGSGSYADQVLWRVSFYPAILLHSLAELPLVLGLMSAGMLAWRRGYLSRPSEHRYLTKGVLLAGLGGGLLLNLLTVWSVHPAALLTLTYLQRVVGGVLLGSGFAMALAVAVERGWCHRALGLLGCVGRRALSVYVLQSLLGSVVFYSWGLGLFGRLDPMERLAVLAGVWGVVVAAAAVADRLGVRGPLEWLWRRLAPTQ